MESETMEGIKAGTHVVKVSAQTQEGLPCFFEISGEGIDGLKRAFVDFLAFYDEIALKPYDGFGSNRNSGSKTESAPLPKSARAPARSDDREVATECGVCGSEDLWDNRKNKKNPKGPDFKCKECKSAVWYDSDGNLGEWQE